MIAYSEEYHLRYGIHSGVPICCIKDWILLDRMVDRELRTSLRVQRLERWGLTAPEVKYLPCEDCAERIAGGAAPAPVHKCDYDLELCAPYWWAEGRIDREQGFEPNTRVPA